MPVKRLSALSFEPRDIYQVLGVDRNRLFYWTNTHRLLRPDVEEAKGPGERAKYSLRNLIEIAAINEMVKFGLPLRTIKIIKDNLDTALVFKPLANPKSAFYRFLKSSGYDLPSKEEEVEFDISMGEWMRAMFIEIRRTQVGIALWLNSKKYKVYKDEFGTPAAGGFENVLKPLTPGVDNRPKGYFVTRFELGGLAFDLLRRIKVIDGDQEIEPKK